MAKLELKGKIHVVEPIVLVGENNLRKQVIYFYVPAYRDQFGDIKGQDQIWPLAVLGDHIDKLAINESYEGKQGTATVFIDASTGKDKDGKEIYFLNATLWKFDLHIPKKS